MDVSEILRHVDHTELKTTATWEDIRELCDDAIRYRTASVCIPASYVKQAKEYVGDRMTVCTVIGFPNGYTTTAAKVFEAVNAIGNGASEIDMVINLGWVKDGRFADVQAEIATLKAACGKNILKVIIEACQLTEEEKIHMCEAVTAAGADYIKTSTGFSTGGATFEDVKLFKEHVGENVKIKAAGGIKSLEDAEEFLRLGADRLGTSRIVKLAKQTEA
ncbi:MAG TPA: deoxyribose-phosphate aldolase [Lachnospiraceae bacterium]|nr:deoxyribose-phosphate aldolase [Lachnospiraceae bacterium]